MKILPAIIVLGLIAALHTDAAPFGSAFTYQGRLASAGQPVSGEFDFEFGLWTAPTNGTSMKINARDKVPVTNGLFTVELDFGVEAFNGEPRWLEIAVRNPDLNPTEDFVLLTPRTLLTPTPYALLSGGVVDGSITAAMLASNSITGDKIAAGAIGTSQLASNSVTAAQLAPGAALANLGGSGFGSLPSTAMVLSEFEVNPNLLEAGFTATGIVITNRNDVWASLPAGPPASGVLTLERQEHSAIWITNFSEMFIIGGEPNKVGMRYKPALNSWTFITSVNAPTLSENCVLAWTGTSLLVWNARNGVGGRYNPNNNTWQTMSETGAPTPRVGQVSVWTGTRLIIWGGHLSDGQVISYNNGASYNPTTDAWQPLGATGVPTGRWGATAVWSGTEMLVFGGASSDTYASIQDEGGRYNPSTDSWTSLALLPFSVQHGGRLYHTAVWTGSRMIIVGGRNRDNILQSTDWQFNPAAGTWATIASRPFLPTVNGHNAVWTGTHLFIWAGVVGDNTNGARYTPASDTWTQLPSTGTAPRYFSSAVWTGTELLGWGGKWDNSNDPTDDGRRYNLAANTWSAMSTPPASGDPSERSDAAAVWAGDRLFVWGGENSGIRFRSGGIYRPGLGWTNTPSVGAPSARANHTAVWTGNEVIVWGGSDGFQVNTGARFNIASNKWFTMNLTNAPTPRRNHSAIWTGTEMIIWGGYQLTNSLTPAFLNTGGRYNPATDSWDTNFPVNFVVGGRANHTAVWTGTEMLIWGGYSKSGNIISPTFTYFGTGARYTPGSSNLVLLPLAPAGNQRTDHTAVWTGSEMLLWGGLNSAGSTNVGATGLRFNPVSNVWTAMPTNNAPSARAEATAVWTGQFMFIAGGQFAGTTSSEGGLFDPLANKWNLTTGLGRYRHTAVWTGTQMFAGNGLSSGGSPSDFWTSFTPRRILYLYQKP